MNDRLATTEAAAGARGMMLRGDWRYLDGDPPVSRLFRTTVALAAAVVFGVVWVTASLMLLAGLALRSF